MKHFIDYREVARHVALFVAHSGFEGEADFMHIFDVAEEIEREAVRRQDIQLAKEAQEYASKPQVTNG